MVASCYVAFPLGVEGQHTALVSSHHEDGGKVLTHHLQPAHVLPSWSGTLGDRDSAVCAHVCACVCVMYIENITCICRQVTNVLLIATTTCNCVVFIYYSVPSRQRSQYLYIHAAYIAISLASLECSCNNSPSRMCRRVWDTKRQQTAVVSPYYSTELHTYTIPVLPKLLAAIHLHLSVAYAADICSYSPTWRRRSVSYISVILPRLDSPFCQGPWRPTHWIHSPASDGTCLCCGEPIGTGCNYS